MNALVKKEIRLLLPAFLLGLALALSLWLIPAKPAGGLREGLAALPLLCCPLVLVMMMLASFGHEFSAGTFPLLLSQPVPRSRIWWTKTLLLGVAALLIWLVWCICYLLHNPGILGSSDLLRIFVGFALCILAGYSGALWTTLLFRQVATAFWITILVPAILVATLGNLLDNYPAYVRFGVPAGVFVLYGIAGFLLARHLFLRAQDTAWSGAIIPLPRWKPSSAYSETTDRSRRWKPISALLKKEFQLQQAALAGAGVLLGLHIAAILVRIFYRGLHENLLVGVVSGFVWSFWLTMPVIIGCVAVAEERRLGVLEGQLCPPVSRRVQFALKLLMVISLGTVFGAVIPLLLEHIAGGLGVPGSMFEKGSHTYDEFGFGLVWFQIPIVIQAAGLSLVCFFASTLAKSFLQALSIAVVTGIIMALFIVSVIGFVSFHWITIFGITPWHSILPFFIAFLVIPAMLLWLAWLNFNHYREGRRLWWRNLLGVAGAMVFIIASSTAIYNRIWEVFEPAEPPHGPATFSLLAPPKLQTGSSGDLLVQLPGGRVWFDSLHYPGFENEPDWWQEAWRNLVPPLPRSGGPQQFIAGSDWISVRAKRVEHWAPNGTTNIHIVGYLDTVGIKSNGTLWISSEAKPVVWTGAKMIRFGDETNWHQVAQANGHLLLLKTDGTLWDWNWGTNYDSWRQWQTNWPSVRGFKPQQIGTNSDWKEILNGWTGLAKKADGSVWVMDWNYKNGNEQLKLERATGFDPVLLQTFSRGWNTEAYLCTNGTLWAHISHWVHGKDVSPGFLQIGHATHWVSVAVDDRWMVALKSDGSLWKWNNLLEATAAELAHTPPTRLGVHHDWVALGDSRGGFVSLATDGSLWLWPGASYNQWALLKCPKQPLFIGNIFGKPD